MKFLRLLGTKVGRLSFRARLGAFIALAAGLTVALAAIASYFVVRQQLYSQLDSSLRSTFVPGDTINSAREGAILSRGGNGFLQVIFPDGGVVFNSLQTLVTGAVQLRP